MTHIVQQIAFGSAEYVAACQLRDAVLRIPLGQRLSSKDTEGEECQLHFAAFTATQLVATLTVKPLSSTVVKFRQMAVAQEVQGSGVGAQLFRYAMTNMAARGFLEAELHARDYATGFYRKLGYKAEGELFLESGIPHLRMTGPLPLP